VSQDIFAQMTSQMQLLTDGLALTKSDVDKQRCDLTAAKLDLGDTKTQLDQTKQDLVKAKAQNAELQHRLVSHDSSFSWDKLGNGDQYQFNCSVLNTLTQAATALEETQPDEAKAFVRAGIVKVTRRNKLVKLADVSSAGWGFVEEYERNSLADNAEDDREIRRAEAAAVAKKKRKYEVNQQRGGYGGRGKSFKGRGGYSAAFSAPESDNAENPFTWFLQQAALAVQANAASTTPAAAAAPVAAPAPVPFAKKKELGPCYYCSGPHLQSQCAAYKHQQAILKAHHARTQQGDGDAPSN
jgi:hypothetical protein